MEFLWNSSKWQEKFDNIPIRKLGDHWIILKFWIPAREDFLKNYAAICFRLEIKVEKVSSEFFKNLDHNRILQEFWLEFYLETLVANTSDDLRILQEFQSEFWLEMQLTAEWNSD